MSFSDSHWYCTTCGDESCLLEMQNMLREKKHTQACKPDLQDSSSRTHAAKSYSLMIVIGQDVQGLVKSLGPFAMLKCSLFLLQCLTVTSIRCFSCKKQLLGQDYVILCQKEIASIFKQIKSTGKNLQSKHISDLLFIVSCYFFLWS